MKKTLSLSLAAALTVATMLPNAHAADAKAVSTSAAKAHGQMAANKALVLKAYQELFGDHDLTALDRYWAKEYIQHNPSMGDGTDAVKQFMEKPKAKVDILRSAAEGDLIFIQIRQPKSPQSPEMVIVDIFRVANGKIAEHWDVMQAVPADAVNKRSMY
jgi:predicted SnoaL-like aldol condensation-catalyzing enzyme